MPNRKLDLVLGLREYIPEDQREPWQQAMTTWWVNLRQDGGMRLTRHGYEIMHDLLKLESWALDLSHLGPLTVDKRLLLDLDRKLQWPYYLHSDARQRRRRIIFFGSREAMMATMYGDIKRWLDSLESRRIDHDSSGS